MNNEHEISRRLQALESERSAMAKRLEQLAAELDELRELSKTEESPAPVDQISTPQPPPPPLPEAINQLAETEAKTELPEEKPESAVAHLPQADDDVVSKAPAPEQSQVSPPRHVPSPVAPAVPPAKPSDEAEEGWEFKLGRIWLVRFGVVLLITALVLFANYAYQSLIMNFGPLAKSALLMLASVGVGLAGTVLGRRQGMRQFGQVLEAGGLAGGFYVLFASHHVEPLRWLESSLICGVLLMAWVGLMFVVAEIRRSQLLAGFSILLAYYACIVTPLSGFALFATLLLTIAAVGFLLRHEWLGISFLALPATYGMFGFWKFLAPELVTGVEPLLPGPAIGYLACYWLVFSLALLRSGGERASSQLMAAWAALNNAAFFVLGSFVVWEWNRDWFGVWALGLGGLWVVISVLLARSGQRLKLAAQAFMFEGVAVLTLGLLDVIDGASLPVILGFEVAVLALVSRYQWRYGYLTMATLIAGLATILVIVQAVGRDTSLIAGAATAIALAVAGKLVRLGKEQQDLSGFTYIFSIFGVVSISAAFIGAVDAEPAAIYLLAVSVALAVCGSWIKFTELAHAGLLAAVAAYLLAGIGLLGDSTTIAGLAIMLGFSITYGQLWLRLPQLHALQVLTQVVLLAVAMAEVWLLAVLVVDLLPMDFHRLGLAAAAILLLLKGRWAGSAWTALAAQALTGIVVAACLWRAFSESGTWWSELGGILALVGALLGASQLLGKRPDFSEYDHSLWQWLRSAVRLLYPSVLVVAAAAWVFGFVPPEHRVWLLTLGALGLVGQAIVREKAWGLWAGFALVLLASIQFLVDRGDGGLVIGDAVGLVMLLIAQRLLRRQGKALQPTSSFLAVLYAALFALGLWILVHVETVALASGLYLTISWSVVGASLLVLGLLLRERVFRWFGLAIIAVAGCRLLFVDLWALGSIARILSFLVLGVLLVGAGFLYNRFPATVKKVIE